MMVHNFVHFVAEVDLECSVISSTRVNWMRIINERNNIGYIKLSLHCRYTFSCNLFIG